MAKSKFDDSGFKKHKTKTDKFREKGLRALGLAMVDTINLVTEEAIRLSPVDTGKLKRVGWKKGSGRNSKEIYGWVMNDVENENNVAYASYTEEGTETQRAQKYLKRASEKGMKELPSFIEIRMAKVFK